MPRAVYLDACCLNRPFDDHSQPRVRLEAEAVLLTVALLIDRSADLEWLGSEVLSFELTQMPDLDRLARVRLLASGIRRVVRLDAEVVARGKSLEAAGFKPYDALHVACAERGGAGVLLTTDDRLLRLGRRLGEQLAVRVANPLEWLTEVE